MNLKESMHIAVLLTCFNRREKTLQALKLLFKQKLPEGVFVEVFLVDDGSTDGTSKAIATKFPLVNIIQGTGTLFWNRGMRKAWETAAQKRDYDYYLWLNDDTNIFDNSLIQMLQVAKQLKSDSIIVGAIHTEDNIKKGSYGGYKNGFLLKPNERLQKCDEFNGNCVLIPKNVFKKLGNLDQCFRHSFGDIEYGRRAKKQGITIFLTPNYVGACNRNVWPPNFLSTKNSLVKRFKMLYSPLGFNPFESFYMNRKYKSIFYAGLVFVKIHINVMFPKIVKKKL